MPPSGLSAYPGGKGSICCTSWLTSLSLQARPPPVDKDLRCFVTPFPCGSRAPWEGAYMTCESSICSWSRLLN